MTLLQLRQFLAIVDAGMNISLAARASNSTQPGLSKQLRLLEDELRSPLFTRQGRQLSGLTPLGQRVMASARMILSETARIKADAASVLGQARSLRVATTHTQARLLLPRPLTALRARYPDLDLHLTPSDPREAIQLVEKGAADIALVSGVERPATHCPVFPVYSWNLVGLRRKGEANPFGEGPASIEALAATPLVTYDSFLQGDAAFAAIFEAHGLRPRIAMGAQDSDTIKTYVRAGMGTGILGEFAITAQDDDLEVVDLHTLFPKRITWAVIQPTASLSPHVADMLRAIMPQFDLAKMAGQAERTPPHWKALGLLQGASASNASTR